MRDIGKVMSALSSPVRREILGLIWDRELPAGAIADAFEVTAPTISQHLAVLRDAGLVTMTASGTSRLYRAHKEGVAGLHGALEGSLKWTPADEVPERTLAEAHTKHGEVLRDRRGRDFERVRDRAGRQLPVPDQAQDLSPHGRAEGGHDLADVPQRAPFTLIR